MDLTQRLAGKVALVTGAGTGQGGGIGAATARRLASEGARVVLADIDKPNAEAIAKEIVQDGGDVRAAYLDLNVEAVIAGLIASVVEEMGTLNILHNNAADTRAEQMAEDLLITQMEASVWDCAFDVNVRGTMLMMKHAIPHMIRAGGGSIINTSSGAWALGDLFAPAYAASKAAINNLTMYAATQFGKQGIRVNAVSPGLVVTPTVRAVVPQAQIELSERHSLTPYLGTPDDLAAAVAFLASDDARYITAQIINVDGGYVSHMPHVADNAAAFAADPTRRPAEV